jgi:hypothetical protein
VSFLVFVVAAVVIPEIFFNLFGSDEMKGTSFFFEISYDETLESVFEVMYNNNSEVCC